VPTLTWLNSGARPAARRKAGADTGYGSRVKGACTALPSMPGAGAAAGAGVAAVAAAGAGEAAVAAAGAALTGAYTMPLQNAYCTMRSRSRSVAAAAAAASAAAAAEEEEKELIILVLTLFAIQQAGRRRHVCLTSDTMLG
jgi:hypothetical protein